MYLVPNIHPGSGSAGVPTVQANFAGSPADWTTLDSTSTMPTGGSISRAGNAMLYAVDGGVAKLTYAPNNILLYNNDFQTTAEAGSTRPWTNGQGSVTPNAIIAPDGTTTASIFTGTGTDGVVRQSIASSALATYIVSAWLKVPTGTKVTYIGMTDGALNNVGNTTITVTNTWQRFSFKFTRTASGVGMYVGGYSTIASGDILHIWGAQIEAVTYQTSPSGTYYLNYPTPNTTSAYYGPRFDYDPVTLQPKGLLVEGTRTNLLNFSQSFATSGGAQNNWADTNITRNSTNNTSPDGTGNALRVTASAANGTIISSAAIGTSAQRVLSVWLRRVTGTGNIQYTLDNGSNWTTQAITSTWARYSFAATTADQQVGFRIVTSGDAIEIWGAQLEAAAFSSSYVFTGSSTVARAAETFSLTGYANRLVEAYYIDEQTGANYSGNSALSSGTVTISPPTFGWVTSLRAYTNAYAGSISTPSWLSFSRAGNAMYYDSTGTLTWAPANLLTYSSSISGATWGTSNIGYTQNIADPFGGTSAVTLTAQTNNAYMLNSAAAAPGRQVISSCWMRRRTGTGNIRLDAPDGSANIVTLTSSWQRISVSGVGASPTTYLQIVIVTSGDAIDIYGPQVEPVTYQTAPSAYIPTTSAAVYGPRYDFDPSTVPATPRGLLIEESRQNLLLQSQTFNTTWTLNNILTFGSGSIADAIIAPDGTMTADKIVENTSPSSHFVNQTATVTNGASYTYSVYAKAGERKYLSIYCVNTAAALNTFFNLSNGTVVSTSSGATSSITSVGNGWYRCSVTTTTTSTTSGIYPGISPDGVNASYTGDGVSGIFLWGAQLEAGSFATSYIPTTTASVTRAADVAQWTSAAQSSYFNAAAGTFGAQIIRNSSGGNNGVFEVPTSAGVNDLIFANTLVNYRYGTGATPDTIINTAFTSARVMAGYTASNFTRSVVANNGTVVTGTSSGASTYTGAGLYIGRAALGTSILNGHLQSFAYYNQRLPDTILKQKSTVGSPY